MGCECKSQIEGKLLDRFKEKAPEAMDHHVSLSGYAFIFGQTVELKGCMQIVCRAQFPLKKGGTKSREIKESMIFTFCPFCGRKYDEEVADAKIGD